ncbi:N-acetylmuramoyl-L-alanine amidase [Ruminococcus sp. FC2018]|uniref:N-acetylmuramoyl-L-alanine amidase n=1 Tax=Ruminococcus sp. FC2018 TaxID=1410617 RepID=UPI001FA76906|nr:N-acetylmuramoyl-L-alanine amidase [Ruminococcus sp. FC2018]
MSLYNRHRGTTGCRGIDRCGTWGMKERYDMMRKVQSGACILMVGIFALIWMLSGKGGTDVPAAGAAGADSKRKVVVLDPGHGGIDGGCVSVNGVAEKGINLAIVQTLRDCFDIAGFDVVCTREDDRSIHDNGVEGIAKQKLSDMKNRLEIMDRYDNALVLSVHQNQFTDPRYSGAQMFYPKDSTEGQRLAECMKAQFTGLLQPKNMRETKPVGNEMYLIHNTKNTAVMIECGFLSNPEEAKLLESADYQKKVAFTIFTGAQEYLISMPKE